MDLDITRSQIVMARDRRTLPLLIRSGVHTANAKWDLCETFIRARELSDCVRGRWPDWQMGRPEPSKRYPALAAAGWSPWISASDRGRPYVSATVLLFNVNGTTSRSLIWIRDGLGHTYYVCMYVCMHACLYVCKLTCPNIPLLSIIFESGAAPGQKLTLGPLAPVTPMVVPVRMYVSFPAPLPLRMHHDSCVLCGCSAPPVILPRSVPLGQNGGILNRGNRKVVGSQIRRVGRVGMTDMFLCPKNP
jgi:hypothetical protein